MKIGIRGYGHYGKLLHELIRRFSLTADVVIYDPQHPADGRVFVESEAMADCTAIIFAVPMGIFEESVHEVLRIPSLRGDTIFFNICSEQKESGATLTKLVGTRPHLSFHTPWGPEAYRELGEDVSKLPPIIVTDLLHLPFNIGDPLMQYLRSKGFSLTTMRADEHDTVLLGRQMYIAHLISKMLSEMQILDDDCSNAPLSFQYIVKGARMLRGDKRLFLDVWTRVPECHNTFEAMIAAAHSLAAEKEQHAAAK